MREPARYDVRSPASGGRVAWLATLGLVAVSCSSNIEKPDLTVPETLPRVEAETALGTVRGVQEGEVLAFYGIPYAAPFSGLDRFLPPKDPMPFDGIFDATDYGQACAQLEDTVPDWLVPDKTERFQAYVGYGEIAAQEKGPNCLNLNLWTPSLPEPVTSEPVTSEPVTSEPVTSESAIPELPSTDSGITAAEPSDAGVDVELGDGGVIAPAVVPVAAPAPPAYSEAPAGNAPKGHPVMVFLHGGGLNQGSNRSAYVHGANLAKKGLVVVNINYRLGNQGFLAGESLFEGDVLVPNRGIMDMVAALRWVRDHAGNFGGDPGRVTVVGESGGGFALWALLSAPSADGLLHRAIVHSAPPVMTPVSDLETVSKNLLEDLGVAPGDTKALAALPDEDIPHTALSEKLLSGDEYGWLSQNNLPFNGAYGTDFIPEDTIPALRAGRSSNVDVMIGINKHEARGLSIMVPVIPDYFATRITSSFLAGFIAPDSDGRDRVREGYEELLPDASGLEREEQIQQDAVFRQPNIRAAEARSQHQKENGGEGRTYMWEFHWESPCCDGEVGAIHVLELAFAFDNMHTAQMLTLGDPTAQPLATAMSDAWVNFAKTGVPSSEGLPEWPVYDEETRKTMVFDRQSKVVEDIEKKRRLFWNEEYARLK